MVQVFFEEIVLYFRRFPMEELVVLFGTDLS